MGKQYWADGATQNCVWLFQVMYKQYPHGCECGIYDDEGCLLDGKTEDNCECYYKEWKTEAVYLTREEANKHGEARPYAWGKKNEGWRIYGVPAHGMMVNYIGDHNEEFENEVEYITKQPKTFRGKVEACRHAKFNGIDCLESKKEYGFFKSDNDIRPSSCTWVDKEVVAKLFVLYNKDGGSS